MSTSDSYIPGPDALAKDWFVNFASRLQNYSLYQISAADASNIQSAVDDFVAKYLLAVEPGTRTPVSVTNKDASRNVCEQLCRQFAQQIKLNVGVSDGDKVLAGIRPVNNSRDPINPPASSPLLNVLGATPGSHTIRYSDTSTPDSPAKPPGGQQIQIWVAVGPEPTTDENEAKFYGAFTRNPIGVSFSEEDDGKVATYFARWATVKGDTGPWSLPISMRIAA